MTHDHRVDEPRVLVVALTYNRPDDLTQLIPALLTEAESVSECCDVLIVDNEPQAGARDLVESMASPALGYVHAATPGIAAARNVALDSAAAYDVLVFIDDDERPTPGWLQSLLTTYQRFGSTAVAGPVISRFALPPDPWIATGGFFNRRRLPTGTTVDLVATNNLLLDMEWTRKSGIRFDEEFGLAGGSDTLFARRFHAAGASMTWCDEAIVYDIVPPHRATRSWVMRRAFRSGNSWVRTSLALASTPSEQFRTRTRLAFEGILRVVGGSARICLGTLSFRMDHRARGARTVARGAGLLAGAAGSVYLEYKR